MLRMIVIPHILHWIVSASNNVVKFLVSDPEMLYDKTGEARKKDICSRSPTL